MLNKKAIAAFAAGATLLSGFAFAAPAMAACPDPAPFKSAAKTSADAAYKAYTDAKAVLDGMTVSPAPAKDSEAEHYTVTILATGLLKNNADPSEVSHDLYVKVQKYVDAYNANVTETRAKEAQQTKVNDLLAKYLDAKNVLENCAVPDPTEDQVKRALINKVRLAKMNLDNKDDELAVAKNKFNDAYKALVAAIAEYNARMDAFSAANGKLNAFLASGVNDSATLTHLRDAADRAEAHLKRATLALAKAKAAYDDALAKDLAAVAAYNKALQTYKDVYNEAVAAGVNPALLPPVVTSDPLDPKVPAVPGLKHAYASAMSGKFGKEVQAAAKQGQKGKDTKASAQQNNNANGAAAGANGAAAAGLAKTGAAVAMAAVAASVLAGMGAALRKIRH
ncbi:hypothetical protein HXT50_05685 [Gardnerella sp. KA00243]|uniref:hypothetical protein n=1 Tax=Gardnerella sp. KA00243 TaxID=2749072 RepID=UPI003BAD98BC